MGLPIRVRVLFEWNDYTRRALAHQYGRHQRLATRDECRNYSAMYGDSTNDDLSAEYEACDECQGRQSD